jgi:hypothetical protein
MSAQPSRSNWRMRTVRPELIEGCEAIGVLLSGAGGFVAVRARVRFDKLQANFASGVVTLTYISHSIGTA